jgi:hypothetical protein
MRIMKPVLTGMALAIAGTITVGMADAALAKTKKTDDSSATQANQARPSDLGGSDRQLQGRFYKSSHKSHKAKTAAKS